MMRMGSAVIAVGCFISVACSSGSAPSESAPAGQSFESTPTGGSARSPSALPNVSSNAPQPGNGAARTCPAEAATTCAAAVHLGSAADFLAAVGRLTWQFVSLSHTGALTLGGDLVADVDLEIDASQLVTPSTCPTTPAAGKPYPRCHAPLFREYAFPLWNGSGRIAGVSCKVVGDRPLRKGDTCARIAIAKGATFRLRAVSEDMHPSAPTYWSFIEFERECSAPCEADETRCAASQTCFARGYASCAYCEGLSAAVCACRDACGTKADAAECEFDTSPDTGVAGMCQSGSCVSAR